MIERLLLAALLVAGIAGAIALVRLMLRRRDARILSRLRARDTAGATGDNGTAEDPEASPRIVYFTTETCVVCRAQQEPALERLQERVPELRLERYDAVREQGLAKEYGVLSVPTTAVYARSGELVNINRGFASAAVLLAQVEGRDVAFEGGVEMAGESLDERKN